MTRKILMTAVTASLLLAAATGSAVAGAAGGSHAAAIKTITLRDSFFSPKRITVSRGTFLRFVWRGRLPHNLVGPGVNVGARRSGSTVVRPSRSVSYLCTIHRGMAVRVTVR